VLKKLSIQGIVVHVNGRYSISQVDLRYIGGLFGHLALDYLFGEKPHNLPINESLCKLVTGFGVLAFYMFIEASRPLENDAPTNQERNVWLLKSFPVNAMFWRFFDAYCEFDDLLKEELYTIHELTQALEELYPYESKQIQLARNLLTSRVSGNLRELSVCIKH
jgi:hypothetical protein